MSCLCIVRAESKGGSRPGVWAEQERRTAWPMFSLALYLDVVLSLEVPQLALKIDALDWSIRANGKNL